MWMIIRLLFSTGAAVLLGGWAAPHIMRFKQMSSSKRVDPLGGALTGFLMTGMSIGMLVPQDLASVELMSRIAFIAMLGGAGLGALLTKRLLDAQGRSETLTAANHSGST